MIPLSKQTITDKAIDLVGNVLRSGWWTMGKVTKELEEKFAARYEGMYPVAVSSCSMGLWLSVKALASSMGYEGEKWGAIVPALTFCSTVNAVIHAGGAPVMVDVDPASQCIDTDFVKELIKGWKKKNDFSLAGLVIVHFGGQSCNMNGVVEAILSHEKRREFFLVEDCAHAVDTIYRTRWVNAKWAGWWGHASCFSFNPIKNLAAPEMGMVIARKEEIAEKLRSLRIHGMSCSAFDRMNKPGQYLIEDLGYKANCTDVEAAVALAQMDNQELNWRRRDWIWGRYDDAFRDLKKRGLFNGLAGSDLVVEEFNVRHGRHLYTVLLGNRDDFVRRMLGKEIYCGIHYRPVHLHPYYARRYGWREGDFPVSEWIGKHTLSLPLGPGMTDADVSCVLDAVEEVLKEGDYELKERWDGKTF